MDELESETARLVADLETAGEGELAALTTSLIRLLDEQHILQWLLNLLDDAGRRDLPVGIVHLVDELIAALVPAGADPIIHLEREYNMYSTLDVLEIIEKEIHPDDAADDEAAVGHLVRPQAPTQAGTPDAGYGGLYRAVRHLRREVPHGRSTQRAHWDIRMRALCGGSGGIVMLAQEDIDALNGRMSDYWLAHKGARIIGRWVLGENPPELQDAAFRTALAVRLFGRDAMYILRLRAYSD